MAKLSDFKRNMAKVLDSGEWVNPGDEYNGLEILTKGFTDKYTDMRNNLLRRTAVQKYRGDASKITTAESRAMTIDCLEAECLLGVRNLADETGEPVTLSAFVMMLRDPDYKDLFDAALVACANVGRARTDDTGADVKN